MFCNVTKDSLVLGQCCGVTQRSLFIARAFSEEDGLCVSFATYIWPLFLFKGRQIIESQLEGTLKDLLVPTTPATGPDCSKLHPNWPETLPEREAKVFNWLK